MSNFSSYTLYVTPPHFFSQYTIISKSTPPPVLCLIEGLIATACHSCSQLFVRLSFQILTNYLILKDIPVYHLVIPGHLSFLVLKKKHFQISLFIIFIFILEEGGEKEDEQVLKNFDFLGQEDGNSEQGMQCSQYIYIQLHNYNCQGFSLFILRNFTLIVNYQNRKFLGFTIFFFLKKICVQLMKWQLMCGFEKSMNFD